MADPVIDPHHGHLQFTLNADGRRHPLQNALSVLALVIGAVSLVLGIMIIASSQVSPGLAMPAGIVGLVSLFVGLYAQMISNTTEQRVLIVTGIIVGFIGLAMGVAHGAFG